MVDGLKDVTVLSKGGLFTNEDALSLANTNPGAALRMLNMEISQFGGYRRISGYADYDSSFGTVAGAGQILGLWILNGIPYAARRNIKDHNGALGTNPFVVTSGSATITVTHSSHGLVVGNRVQYSGSAAVGGITPNGVDMAILSVVNSNSYTVAFTSAASSGVTGGGGSVKFKVNAITQALPNNPLAVANGSSTITVTDNSHGLIVGNLVTFTGSPAIGGITPNAVEMKVVSVPNANTYTVSFTSNATSTASGVGGSSITATYSQSYSIYKYTTSGWIPIASNRSNAEVLKLRESRNSFTGTESVIICDGVNTSAKFDGTTFTEHSVGDDASPLGASLTTDFKNHQFYSGFPSTALGENKLLFSEPNVDNRFRSASGSGSINVGFNITGIAKFRDSLYVFGKDKIKRLTGSSSSDFSLAEVTNNVGCIATDSIIEIGGDVLFLASDGIRPIQGTARIGDVELETISKPVQQLLQSLPGTHALENMSSVVIRNKSQFRYFFPKTSTAASDTAGIIGGLRFADRRVGWEFGELLGVRAFAATSGLINNVEVVLHGDLNGEVYQQESGNTFDGSDVTAVYATPFLYFDSTEKRKVFQRITLFTRPEGESTVNLGVAYNWDDPSTPDPSTYSLTTAGSLARFTTTNSRYDATFTFDGSTSPVLGTNIQGSGRSISLVITSTGTQAPYSVSGFSITYQDAGYR
tara:strand:+ start:833 stop:2929 length:2097 start_codon:yes stop_codon:yes gene_type:complete